jgi:Leucine-rich repeat (LRR) protein
VKSYQQFLRESVTPVTEIDIANEGYKKCPILPATLLIFNCTDNKIQDFPQGLPPNLEEFYCPGNGIYTLPPLPLTLKKLGCSDNNLKELPELPEGIIQVFCPRNKITKLPRIPKSVEEFYCVGNPLEDVIPAEYIDLNRVNDKEWFDKYIQEIQSYKHQKMMAEKYGAVKLIEFRDYLHPRIRQEYPEISGSQQFGFFD